MSGPHRSLRRRGLLWIPPALYAFAIFYVSSQSDPLPQVTAVVSDKLLHAIEYAGFAVLLCRAFRGEGLRWWPSVALAVLVASGYAATDEWHQRLVPGRESGLPDWTADTIGAAIGSGVYRLTFS